MKPFLFYALLAALILCTGPLSVADSASATRMQQANEALQKGNLDKVIELLNPYTDQLSQPGYLTLANAYSRKKDYANEVRVLNLLVSKDEENYKWQILLAQANLKLAKTTTDPIRNKELVDLGIQKLRKALEISPKYKPAFDLLVQTLLTQKANYEARELLHDGLNKFGKRPEIFKELCRLNSSDGFLVEAVDTCKQSIKYSPDFPDSYVYLVQALSDQGEDVLAEKEIVAAGRKFARSEFVQWAGGTFFYKKKNISVATRYFEQAVAAQADSGRSQFGLANALLEQNEFERALPAFVAACKAKFADAQETFLNAASRLRQKGLGPMAEKYSSAAYSCAK